jgi:hypothetical protein
MTSDCTVQSGPVVSNDAYPGFDHSKTLARMKILPAGAHTHDLRSNDHREPYPHGSACPERSPLVGGGREVVACCEVHAATPHSVLPWVAAHHDADTRWQQWPPGHGSAERNAASPYTPKMITDAHQCAGRDLWPVGLRLAVRPGHLLGVFFGVRTKRRSAVEGSARLGHRAPHPAWPSCSDAALIGSTRLLVGPPG